MDSSAVSSLGDLRSRIEVVDEVLVRTLRMRAELVLEIYLAKIASGLPVQDLDREAVLAGLWLETYAAAAGRELTPHEEAHVVDLFRAVLRTTAEFAYADDWAAAGVPF